MVNDAALAYMRKAKLLDAAIECLARYRHFSRNADWEAHLDRIEPTKMTGTARAPLIATEAAVWGCVVEHAHLQGTTIVREGVPQFRGENHALCRVHMERHYATMVGHSDDHRRAIEAPASSFRCAVSKHAPFNR